jgi:beta-glucosidase
MNLNELNGVPATGSAYYKEKFERGRKFDGFCCLIGVLSMKHAWFCKDSKMSLLMRSDMDMESSAYVDHLVCISSRRQVKESIIDDAVKGISKVNLN